mmetsp:Transcript_11555/g.23837  ORF Transcript_11555/g.23837 Transcript_11555/m.23837 type:complete len:259 (-) Transcript_11555:477-1253(-)
MLLLNNTKGIRDCSNIKMYRSSCIDASTRCFRAVWRSGRKGCWLGFRRNHRFVFARRKVEKKVLDHWCDDLVHAPSIAMKNMTAVWNRLEDCRTISYGWREKVFALFETADLVLLRPNYEALAVGIHIGGHRKLIFVIVAVITPIVCSTCHEKFVLERPIVSFGDISKRQPVYHLIGNFRKGILLFATFLLFDCTNTSFLGVRPEKVSKELFDVLPAAKVHESVFSFQQAAQELFGEAMREGGCKQDGFLDNIRALRL